MLPWNMRAKTNCLSLRSALLSRNIYTVTQNTSHLLPLRLPEPSSTEAGSTYCHN